jgi:hypothetical protein
MGGGSPAHRALGEKKGQLGWTRTAGFATLSPPILIFSRADSAMSHSVSTPGNRSRVGRLCLASAIGLCLGLAGCSSMDLRGEKFQDNELSSFCGKLRPKDHSVEPAAVCNKAQQIENDFGIH